MQSEKNPTGWQACWTTPFIAIYREDLDRLMKLTSILQKTMYKSHIIEYAFPIHLNKLFSFSCRWIKPIHFLTFSCYEICLSVSLGEYSLAWVFQRLPVTQCAGITASGIVGGNAFELPSLLFDLNTCILDGISPSSSWQFNRKWWS